MADEPPALRRAILLITATNFLVPVVGLLTQPILARALGTTGRGELAAALAPAVLLGSVATLGLPDALTFFTAAGSRRSRRALAWSLLLSFLAAVVCLGGVLWAAPVLAGGDVTLAGLITLGMGISIPVFLVGALRGSARGHQAWGLIAVESALNSGLRLLGFLVLWLSGNLTVLNGLVLTVATQVLAGVVYLPMAFRRVGGTTGAPPTSPVEEDPLARRTVGPLLRYGMRTWFGAVAGMLLARTAQVLMVPLASVEDLGLWTVAVMISDVPIMLAMSAAYALQGVNSKTNDAEQVAKTCRTVLLATGIACLGLGATLPLWLRPVFGADFAGALLPTVVLLVAALVAAPGFVAAAGLASVNRPGLRSMGFFTTFVVNLVLFVVLVPRLGIMGAAVAALVSNLWMSAYFLARTSTIMGVRPGRFVRVTKDDLQALVLFARSVLARVVRRGRPA